MAHADMADFIEADLLRLGYEVSGVRSSGVWLKSRCVNPNHRDTTPSFAINRFTGGFNCFGCEIKGREWNDLSEWLPITELRPDDDRRPDPFRVRRRRLADRRKRDSLIPHIPWDATPWEGNWTLPNTRIRIAPATLKALDARRWYDDRDRCYRILFPCWQLEELVGYAARRLDDRELKQQEMKVERKWRNSDGFQAKDVLFPLDAVARMESDYVVLVEGPGDAVRLLNYDIPALSIMGTYNWNKEIAIMQLLHVEAKTVIIAMDSDDSGLGARARIAADLEQHFNVKHFYCPGEHDPGSMPTSAMNMLWRMTRKRHRRGRR